MMALLMAFVSDSLKTADDWANTSTQDDGTDGIKDGDQNRDNLEERAELMNQINELQFLMVQGLISCQLPNGEVLQLSPEECLARGGIILDGNSSLADLWALLNGLGGPLDKLGSDFGGRYLSNQVITSLLNLNEDVTIGKAIKRKGKRYGFYQSDIKKNK